MITVGNVKRGDKGEYIGRKGFGRCQSPLHNPFALNVESDRQQVVDRFREYIFTKIKAGDPVIASELKRLKTLSTEGDLVLVCWCAPKACHGDVIKEILEGM